MRIASSTGSIKENVWKIIPLALSFTLLSCSTTGKGRYKHLPPKKPAVQRIEKERDKETGAKKEIIRTEPRPIETGPKSIASAKLTETGKYQLAQGNFEAAEDLFQEAINIDPSNGIAYYYLSKAKFELGRLEQADGVLDKAEELLAGSRQWMEAIAELRKIIKEKI